MLQRAGTISNEPNEINKLYRYMIVSLCCSCIEVALSYLCKLKSTAYIQAGWAACNETRAHYQLLYNTIS